MSEVQFEEDQYESARTQPGSDAPSSLTRLVIRAGLARDRRGASKVLAWIAVLCVLAAGFFSLFWSTSDGTSSRHLTPAEFEAL